MVLNVSPATPQPFSLFTKPDRVYIIVSKSGQILSPYNHVSSPVFTITVRSSGGKTCAKPNASLAPPTPPTNTTTFIAKSHSLPKVYGSFRASRLHSPSSKVLEVANHPANSAHF